MTADPPARALSALARFQVTDASVGGTLNRIAEITLEAMSSAAIVGMTMLGEDEQPTTAIYTNPESPEIDAAHYRGGKGPCLDAWRHKKVFRVGRVEDDAFDLLRKASQRENVKLRVIAQRIVERRPPASGQPEGGAP